MEVSKANDASKACSRSDNGEAREAPDIERDIEEFICEDREEEIEMEWYKYNCESEETEDWIADIVKYYSKFNSFL
jgi:hypothetical protein